MRRKQRYRYEMFVRVRDFGMANRDVFPESSKAGRGFADVTAAVGAIEDHLTKRDIARVEARLVKASTRAAVANYMKAIVKTARRATMDEPGPSPFVLPARHTAAALLSAARAFIDESKPREATFVEFGLPADFISTFTGLVEQLQEAVDVRNSGRALRARAQSGIEDALTRGLEIIRNLDVLVANALVGDPVRLGYWRSARRIDGLNPRPSAAAKMPLATPSLTPLSSTDTTMKGLATPPVVSIEKAS